jgi:hypothetical protein
MEKVFPKPFPILELANILLELNFIKAIPDRVYKMGN